MSQEAIPKLPFTQPRRLPKQLHQLHALYDETVGIYNDSALAQTVQGMLRNRSQPRISRIISLGLGSLLPSKDQQRRMKQLVMLMAIASHLTSPPTEKSPVALYAQDPTFTTTDETFLHSLGIRVLRTPSLSELGEAGRMMDGETLIYSPFLTIATYKLLLSPQSPTQFSNLPMLISDDFNALKLKWDKRTQERRDVEGLISVARTENYLRRALAGDGFWEETDRPFPMAVYWRQPLDDRKPVHKGHGPRGKQRGKNGVLQHEQRLVAISA